MEIDENAGYRAAWGAVKQFDLHQHFPLVKQRYFESTIGRMAGGEKIGGRGLRDEDRGPRVKG